MRRQSSPVAEVSATCAQLLAALCALGALLAHGGRVTRRLDLLTHFAPLYILGAGLAVLIVIITRRQVRPTLVLAAIALVGAAALIAPEFLRSTGPRASAGAPDQIKIIQFNVGRSNRDLPHVVDWLVAENPDVVTLNESSASVRDAIVRRTGWHVSGGMGDLMIFTPRERSRMDRLAGYAMVVTWVNATYLSSSGPFEVLTAHLRWPNGPEIPVQEKTLSILMAALPADRTILTGDLNSTPWSFNRQRDDRTLGLIRRDRAVATWPTWSPVAFLPIDHIYAGPGWATVKVERGPNLGSDHYPLIVTLAPVSRPPAAPH